MLDVEKVHTPDVHTIDEVVDFLKAGVRPENTLKSLLYVAGDETVMAVVRGDHDINEVKLARALGAAEVRMASDVEVEAATGAKTGFAGPVRLQGQARRRPRRLPRAQRGRWRQRDRLPPEEREPWS